MDGLIEVIAILVYLVIAGLVGLNRYMRKQFEDQSAESQGEKKPTSAPPTPPPTRPTYRPMGEGSREQKPSAPQRDPRKTLTRPPQQPQKTGQDAKKTDQDENWLDPMRDVLKELLGAEEPEVIDLPPEKPKRRPKKAKTRKKQEEKVAKPQKQQSEPLRRPAQPVQQHSFMLNLAKEAETNPLRAMVIYSEVLKRPRSAMNNPFYLRNRNR